MFLPVPPMLDFAEYTGWLIFLFPPVFYLLKAKLLEKDVFPLLMTFWTIWSLFA